MPDRRRAVTGMIRAWARDIDAGRDPLLLAYRRDNVEALNRVARDLCERSGRLTGPELTAPGGRTYRAGDQVITLAPGPNGAWVTSQAARVTAVDPEAQTVTAVTPHGRHLRLGTSADSNGRPTTPGPPSVSPSFVPSPENSSRVFHLTSPSSSSK